MTERRHGKRHAKRMEVRFWIEGEPETHSGHTQNISVPTRYPAQLHEEVDVGLHVPGASGAIRSRAQVVHRVEPGSSAALPGMGVAFGDLKKLLFRLKPHLERLRGGGG
jgi:hypothetical protein